MFAEAKQKAMDRLIPQAINDRFTRVGDRITALEEWHNLDVSPWASQVDTAIDQIDGSQKTLSEKMAATQEDLAKARQDAVDMALSKFGLPEGIAPGDVGAFLGKIRDVAKKVPPAFKVQGFSTVSLIAGSGTVQGQGQTTTTTTTTTTPGATTPGGGFAFQRMGGPANLGVAPAARRRFMDSLGPDIPGVDDFVKRLESLMITDYDKIKTITYQWDKFYEGVNDYIANKSDVVSAVQWTWKVRSDINNMIDNGNLPAKAIAGVQNRIDKVFKDVSAMASAATLSSDKLSAIQQLLTKVEGYDITVIQATQSVTKWYYTREDSIKTLANNAITAYQNGQLGDFIKNKIDGYVTSVDFRDAVRAKIDATTLKEKIKTWLINIPGVEGFIDEFTAMYTEFKGTVDKLVAGFKEGYRIMAVQLPEVVSRNVDQLDAYIETWGKSFKSDMDRKPSAGVWTPDLVKQYAHDLVDDVKNLAKTIKERVLEIMHYIAGNVKEAFNAIYGPIKDIVIEVTGADGLKARLSVT